MREIVFRGKRTDNGEWVEGWYIHTKRHHCIITGCIDDGYVVYGHYASDVAMYVVNPATVGQYTGLKDKNGKRIFEGDIVKAQDNLIFSPFCDGLVGKVVYIETAFFIEPKDPAKSEYLFNECAVYEVLGNIHDNPELMEVQ